MSQFKPYPAYSYSGFDWLPEVPAHWVDRKIARDIPFVVGWTPPSGKDEYYDGDLPWVTIADMTQMSVEDTKSKISHLAVQDKGAKIVPAGSMLFSFKLSVGKIAFLTIDSYTNEAIAGFLPSGPLDLGYWKYAAPEFIPRHGRENIYGATLLNQELISAVRFFAPERTEQTQIARFLDHETARIDALIEEQQRLIALLQEKRQAVISHAVTKGPDPTVPMKDSGVEWLGGVPVHWDIKRLKQLVLDANGIQMGPFGGMLVDLVDSDTGYKVYGQENTISGDFSSGSRWVSESRYLALSNYHLYAGDIVLTRKGSLGNCRRVSILPQAGIIDSDTIRVRVLGHLIDPNYLEVLLHEVGYISVQLSLAKRGAILSGLNTEIIASLTIVVPPVGEQKEILRDITSTSAIFEQGISDCEHAVRLLQERRSALISAAVTGKIDVRGWQPPASVSSPVLEEEAV